MIKTEIIEIIRLESLYALKQAIDEQSPHYAQGAKLVTYEHDKENKTLYLSLMITCKHGLGIDEFIETLNKLIDAPVLLVI